MADRSSPSTGPQILRMQKLIEWLRSGRKLTCRLANEDLGVSRRTIASDIGYLKQIGVPVSFDHRKGTYVLTEPFENLPLLPLRRTELAALLVAQHALEVLGDAPHADVLTGTIEKLAEHLPETRPKPDGWLPFMPTQPYYQWSFRVRMMTRDFRLNNKMRADHAIMLDRR